MTKEVYEVEKRNDRSWEALRTKQADSMRRSGVTVNSRMSERMIEKMREV